MTGRQTAATGSCPTGSGSVALLPEHRITSTWGLEEGWGWGTAHFLLSPNPISEPSSLEKEEVEVQLVFRAATGSNKPTLREWKFDGWVSEWVPGVWWARWVIGHLRDRRKPDLWTAINTFMVGDGKFN